VICHTLHDCVHSQYLAGAVYFDSTTAVKFSAHLILPAVAFPSIADAGVFVRRLVAEAAAADDAAGTERMLVSPKPPPRPPSPAGAAPTAAAAGAADGAAAPAARVPFVHTGVYTRNRCFRLVGASKFGKAACLLPVPLPTVPPPVGGGGDGGGAAAAAAPTMAAAEPAAVAAVTRVTRALFLRSLFTAVPTRPPPVVITIGLVTLGGPAGAGAGAGAVAVAGGGHCVDVRPPGAFNESSPLHAEGCLISWTSQRKCCTRTQNFLLDRSLSTPPPALSCQAWRFDSRGHCERAPRV